MRPVQVAPLAGENDVISTFLTFNQIQMTGRPLP